ncbi:ABC transporter family substrate-binding protein [Kitasatospora sp. NPDC085879]|uniref:ABC transporter family substrate-binding protein n=1 Tax=Kitasatospora sp. NPDC085879 TaxID=3154769 RepID=UPI000BB1384C|nr:ABC transporter family substrate-binding protein [Streptomyces sp. TLI_235]PBC77992.1 peptide/nickel transport system substrate-binding protein [Streptomyces sp. TLI_235]
MKQNRIPVALVASIAAASLSLTACSSSGKSDDKAAPPKADAPKMTQRAINEKPRTDLKQGGSLNWAIDQLSSQWNPLEADGNETSTTDVVKAVMPTFWRSDAGGAQTVNKDYLVDAKSETKDGKQVVTWTLNPKAKWSDGTPITWKDIEANWKSQNGSNTAFKATSTTGFDQIESIVKGADDYQAIATFKTPFSEWQALFNNAANAPLFPASQISTPELFNTSYVDKIPVTAGPFKLDKIDQTAKTVTVVADPNWWGNKPLLDKIVYKAMDTNAMPQAFQNGEIDFYNNGPDASGFKQIQATPDGEVREAGGPNFRHFMLNGKSPMLTDPKVRQAIFQGIDRATIGKSDLNGLGWPAEPMNNHFLVPNQNGYKDNSNGLSTFNPEVAKKTLDEAGWKLDGDVRKKDGKELALKFVIPAGVTVATNEGSMLTQMMKQIGVKITVFTAPSNEFFDKYIYKYDFDMTAFSLIGTPFPASSSTANFKTDGGANYSQVGSPELDKAMADAAAAPTTEAAMEAINRADGEAWKVAGLITLYQRPAIFGVKKAVANLGAPGLSDYIYEDIGFTK